jgi:hypothetical protein
MPRASARDFTSPMAMACTITFPAMVASVGPAISGHLIEQFFLRTAADDMDYGDLATRADEFAADRE